MDKKESQCTHQNFHKTESDMRLLTYEALCPPISTQVQTNLVTFETDCGNQGNKIMSSVICCSSNLKPFLSLSLALSSQILYVMLKKLSLQLCLLKSCMSYLKNCHQLCLLKSCMSYLNNCHQLCLLKSCMSCLKKCHQLLSSQTLYVILKQLSLAFVFSNLVCHT